VLETLDIVEIIEDAININRVSLTRHGVSLVREFEPVPPVQMDRHKVLPILVNLLSKCQTCAQSGGAGQAVDGARWPGRRA
jgi:hypothetical protein